MRNLGLALLIEEFNYGILEIFDILVIFNNGNGNPRIMDITSVGDIRYG